MNSLNLLGSRSFQYRQASTSLARKFCWRHYSKSSSCKKSFPNNSTTINRQFELTEMCHNRIFSSQMHSSPLTFATNSPSNPTATATAFSLIKCSQQDGLLTVTLNDKKTRNAMSLQMMKELVSAINSAKSDPNVRCIVLTAPGDTPVFSSGHNLKELTSEHGIAAQRDVLSTCTELMQSIRQAEVPVIAVVRGLAAAAGCQLVAGCDFAVVTDKATFSTPGASFGLFCSTPGVAVSRAANKSMASYMLMTGLTISAEEALRAGLVAKVVPEENLDECLNQIYSSIKSKSRPVIQLGKRFFYEQLEMSYGKALREGENTMMRNLQLKDCQEGLESFKQKRHPVWKHTDDQI